VPLWDDAQRPGIGPKRLFRHPLLPRRRSLAGRKGLIAAHEDLHAVIGNGVRIRGDGRKARPADGGAAFTLSVVLGSVKPIAQAIP